MSKPKISKCAMCATCGGYGKVGTLCGRPVDQTCTGGISCQLTAPCPACSVSVDTDTKRPSRAATGEKT